MSRTVSKARTEPAATFPAIAGAPTGRKFSDADTEAFYDAEDGFYRSFWDAEGSLHWGVFDERTGSDFFKACANLSEIMVQNAQLDARSNVLDLGCGNGTVAAWLCRTAGCRVTGVDLSGVRVDNAERLRGEQSSEVKARLAFTKASATALPYASESFSHVWSQAVIYHVHDKDLALKEVLRVLEPGGRFVFDDLIKPKQQISPEAQALVYDRLKFDTDFSFQSYQRELQEVGFRVLGARDLSAHLMKSYEQLANITESRAKGTAGTKFRETSVTYRRMARAVEMEELGWGLYVCEKPNVAARELPR